MTSINSSSANQDVLADYRIQTEAKKDGSELGKNEFMELMIAQMENQSPLDPQDNGEFISQLAQFSALEETQKMTAKIDDFMTQYQSTQALQASAMVGRTVLVPGSAAPMDANGTVSGVVDIPASTGNMNISIFNGSGELVNQFDMGQQLAGTLPFVWDGTNSDGEYMPFDEYTVRAEASIAGETKQLSTLLSANVSSVSIGQGGAITLNLSGMGAIPLENVREIN